MRIIAAKWDDAAQTVVRVETGDGRTWHSVTAGSRLWAELQDWIAGGNTPTPADPAPVVPPAPLTPEELYDMLVAKGVVSDADRPRPKP